MNQASRWDLLFAMATGSGAVDINLGTWVAEDLICLVVQSCLSLCNPMDCSPPGSSVHADSLGKNTGVGCHALLQGIFPTQGLNMGALHGRQILYHLSHRGSPLRADGTNISELLKQSVVVEGFQLITKLGLSGYLVNELLREWSKIPC